MFVVICFKQVDETIDWLSDYFLRSRLSKADLRSFGLYSAWSPYISEVVSFWDYLVSCLSTVSLSGCARDSVGSNRIMKGKLQSHFVQLDALCSRAWCHPNSSVALSQLFMTCTVRLWSYLSLGSFPWTLKTEGMSTFESRIFTEWYFISTNCTMRNGKTLSWWECVGGIV